MVLFSIFAVVVVAEIVVTQIRKTDTLTPCRSASSDSARWAPASRGGFAAPISTSSACDAGAGALEATRRRARLRRPRYSLDALLLALKAPRTVWCMLPAGERHAAHPRPAAREARARRPRRRRRQRPLPRGDGPRPAGSRRPTSASSTRRLRRHLGARQRLLPDAGWQPGGRRRPGARPPGARPAARAMAPLRSPGAGHFVKMVHNGVEYGLMQAYAEGFALMQGHPDFDLDLAAVAGTWMQGSVVRSWLLELTRDLLAEDASPRGRRAGRRRFRRRAAGPRRRPSSAASPRRSSPPR